MSDEYKHDEIFFNVDHILKEIKSDRFIAVIESFKMDNQPDDKLIIYFQLDLSRCIIKEFKTSSCYFNTHQNEIKDSICKTNKLIENFEKIDKSKEKNKTSLNLFYYLFNVISIGPISSLINTQFKSKLRADIKIEIIPINSNLEENCIQPVEVILVLMSKNLFFYNFLLPNNFYQLKTDKKLEIDHSNSLNMLFIDEKTLISISKVKNDDRVRIFSQKFISLNKENSNFKSDLNGILIEKKILKSNTANYSQKTNLMDHYDLLIPNNEFKLILKIDDQIDNLVTIYYDTRYSLHQLSILPGMKIRISNLIKKSDFVFKSNSFLTSNYFQKINFFGNEVLNNKPENILKQAKLIYDKLDSLDNINESFYTNQHKIDFNDANTRLKFLFENSNEKCLKIIGQILKIYELTIRLKCKFCTNLADMCICDSSSSSFSSDHGNKNTKVVIDSYKYKIELNITFLIDDNTSLLKVIYTNLDFDLKSINSNVFYHISEYITQILLKYLNELYIPILPIQIFNDLDQNYDENLLKSMRQSKFSKKDTTINDNTNFENSFYATNNEDRVKSDIYKILYDYLSNKIVNRYFVFNISQNGKVISKYYNQKSKLNQQFVKLNEGDTNQLFKSIQTVNCNFFNPLNNIDIMDI